VADDHVLLRRRGLGRGVRQATGFPEAQDTLKGRPAVQVLIMSGESRLGREQIETVPSDTPYPFGRCHPVPQAPPRRGPPAGVSHRDGSGAGIAAHATERNVSA
jgi:hypothetical protein